MNWIPHKADFVDRHGNILDIEVLEFLLDGGITDKPIWRAPNEHEIRFLGEAYEAMVKGAALGAYHAIVGESDVLGVGMDAWRVSGGYCSRRHGVRRP